VIGCATLPSARSAMKFAASVLPFTACFHMPFRREKKGPLSGPRQMDGA
jgi:hypothetical protein